MYVLLDRDKNTWKLKKIKRKPVKERNSGLKNQNRNRLYKVANWSSNSVLFFLSFTVYCLLGPSSYQYFASKLFLCDSSWKITWWVIFCWKSASKTSGNIFWPFLMPVFWSLDNSQLIILNHIWLYLITMISETPFE